jgi:hypothetical protein
MGEPSKQTQTQAGEFNITPIDGHATEFPHRHHREVKRKLMIHHHKHKRKERVKTKS